MYAIVIILQNLSNFLAVDKGNIAVGGFGRVLDYCEDGGRLNWMR